MIDFLPDLFSNTPTSVLGGCLLVVYAAITSLRKRRDTSIAELEKRVAELEERLENIQTEHDAEKAGLQSRVTDAETKAEGYQGLMLEAKRNVFSLRSVLAEKGIKDPTVNEQTA